MFSDRARLLRKHVRPIDEENIPDRSQDNGPELVQDDYSGEWVVTDRDRQVSEDS